MGWAGALVAYLVGFVVMRAFAAGGTMGFAVGAIGAIGIDILGILWAGKGFAETDASSPRHPLVQSSLAS